MDQPKTLVMVVAGMREQFLDGVECHMRQIGESPKMNIVLIDHSRNRIETKKRWYIYVASAKQLKGMYFDDIIYTGTFYNRQDLNEIRREAEHRIWCRDAMA